MTQYFSGLHRYRDLLYLWILRTIKVRYKQSALGVLWAILQPLSLMIIFSIVFSLFVKVPTGGMPYPVFSYSALLPWTLFATSISLGITSLTNNINLVTKIYFPREILPLAVIAAALVDFLIGFVVFIGMMLFYRIPIQVTALAFPLLLIIQIILMLGLVLLSSALNVFYRDIQHITPLALQLLMFATPVIYPVTLVPESIRWLYMLNPMAVLIQGYRGVMLYGIWPDPRLLLQATLISAVILYIGYRYFKHVEWQFADII